MKSIYVLMLLVMSVQFYSCNLINPAEEVPTYIQIDSVQVKPTNVAKHGSVNHKISDVWVYYNRQIIGPFELPARVPILAQGHGEVQILAGIYQDGLAITRTKYPFYTVDTFSFDASPAQVIKHTPVFNYRTTDTPAITYHIEDFEQGNIFTKRYNNDTTIVRTNVSSEVLEGDWSGKMYFKDSSDNAESITSTAYPIPPFRDAYMELNYKSDLPFEVATEIFYQSTFINSTILSLKASDKWTKVYIKLGGFADTFQGGTFKFVLRAAKPANVNEAALYFDNFKIIYFN